MTWCEISAAEGEVDVGAWPESTQCPGAIEGGLLHLWHIRQGGVDPLNDGGRQPMVCGVHAEACWCNKVASSCKKALK